MSLIRLSIKSMLSRKLTVLLLILSIGLSTMLLVGIQKIKLSAKHSFSHSISGTDLIIGARSGETQLLLYTVFRQGQPIANMSWDSFKEIQGLSEVKWAIPISLGDSHRGFPVIGTTSDYFSHYRYGSKKNISFLTGQRFQNAFDVVLGSEVARKYNYKLGDQLLLSHGITDKSMRLHKHNPFSVVGILNPTGTPVDKTLHIPLEGFTAIHVDWKNKNLDPNMLVPRSVTGAFIGLTSKFSIFSIQQRITNWKNEALMAIIPGVALSRLWSTIGTIDTAFLIITVLVVIIAFLGLLLSLFMSLDQRRRELSILRSLGAHPYQLFLILIIESLIITIGGVICGLTFMLTTGTLVKPMLENKLGLILSLTSVTMAEVYLALGVVMFGIIISLIPAALAYRRGLSEGFISL